jgi:AAA family ATP:ADP antiporter
MLTVASYTVVKTVRDAVFLSRFSVTELSLLSVGLALLTGFVVALYARLTGGISRPNLIGATNLLIAASLIAIWRGLSHPALADLLPWVLYVWSGVFGVFTIMQFWLLANDLFDAREAKRLFGLVGAGATLGGVAGGLASRLATTTIGTHGLLLVAASCLMVAALLVRVVWPLRRHERTVQGGGAGRVVERRSQAIRRSPYIRLLAAAVLLSTVATTLLGWQFLALAKHHFAARTDEMTAYFGGLSAYLSLASLLIQALLTGRLLRRLGVGLALNGLPLALLVGVTLIAGAAYLPLMSTFFAASLARVAEGGVRFSIDRPSMELMWMPVPQRLKEQGKAFVDTVVDRFGTGIAAIIWLLMALAGLDKPERVHWVGLAIGASVIVWLYVVQRARRGYVEAFRNVLAVRAIDAGRLQVSVVDGEAQRMVAATLASSDPREVLFALYLLEDWPGKLPDLQGALRHPDATVVKEALNVLRRRGDEQHREHAAQCIAHAAEDVREAAIEYMHRTAPTTADPVVEQLTRSGRVDSLTVKVLELGLPAYARDARSAMIQALEEESGERRVQLLRLLGAAPPEAVAELVRPYLLAPEVRLVRAALFAVGRSRCAELVAELTGLLADWRFRRAAGDALRRIGPPAAAELERLASNAGGQVASRKAAARLLGIVGTGSSPEVLLELAQRGEFDLSRRALRALVRLCAHLECEVPRGQLEAVLQRDVERIYRDLSDLGRGSWADLRSASRPEDLVERALVERVHDRVERVFLALSLLYNSVDVRSAYRGLRSPLRSIRASGIELLDNVLSNELKDRLLPLLEGGSAAFLPARGTQRDGSGSTRSRADLLARLLGDRDETLQAVAAWSAGVEGDRSQRSLLRGLTSRTGPLGDVARRALAQLDGELVEVHTMGLTVIEKALKLQKVDVLQHASTEDLAHIAQIAQELSVEAGGPLYREGDAPDALFVVVSGKVRLHRDEIDIALLGEGEAFGSWALVDEAPRVASATVLEDATLLRVGREEFVELLADRVDIVQAVFRAMVARLRELAGVSSAHHE